MIINTFVILIIATIIAAGLLGGIANYYMEQANWAGFKKSVLLGLTASATVPLLLNTMSSSLTKDCLGGDPSAFFVFFGFCTIAAIFSSNFLQTLGDKLIQDLKDVKQKQAELAETTDVLVAQNSDPAPAAPPVLPDSGSDGSELESFKSGDTAKSPTVIALSDDQKMIAALSSKFAFRTVEGIAKDAGMDLATVQSKLLEMEIQGKVKMTKRVRDGIQVWSLR